MDEMEEDVVLAKFGQSRFLVPGTVYAIAEPNPRNSDDNE